MKKNLLFLVLLIIVFAVFSGCNPCKEVICENGGVCDNGECICPPGTSGTFCEEVDSCYMVECLNGGICIGGTCDCPTGYEGTDCGTETRAKFFGDYVVEEVCGGGNYIYTCTIYSSPIEITRVNFTNFLDLLNVGVYDEVYGEVSGTDLVIPSQPIGIFTLVGSGSLDTASGDINFTYTFTGSGINSTCTATYSVM